MTRGCTNQILIHTVKTYISEGTIKGASKVLSIPSSTIHKRIEIALEKKLLTDKQMEQVYKLKKGSYISDDDLIRSASAFNKTGTIVGAADALNISKDAMQKRLRLARIKGFLTDDDDINIGSINNRDKAIKNRNEKIEELKRNNEDLKKQLNDPSILLERDRKILKLTEDNKVLKAKLTASEKELSKAIDQYNILTKLDGRKRKKSKIKSKSGKGEAVACMIASDWHIEEPVDSDSLNGYNEYNLEISHRRSQNFFKNGLFLVKKEMQAVKIDTVVLGLLGDFISNYIHPELEEDALLSPPQAIEQVEDYIQDGIDYLLKDGCFQKLVIPCCIGNHGRTTLKTRMSTGWKNSYEMLMYKHLQKYYKNDPRVEIKLNKGYHNILEIYDHVIRFHHGDAIKYNGGIGGITIPVNRKISRWNDKEHATMDVFGHFHQLIFQSRFVSNGSLIGYNQFAQRIGAAPEPPRQGFFLIDKDHGRTVCAPIFVEE